MSESATLEHMLREIEEIISKLEQSNPNLAEALQLYERGTHLSDACRQLLTQAELTIQDIRQK
jgi:exodeoxyribonuclease VII small subunit